MSVPDAPYSSAVARRTFTFHDTEVLRLSVRRPVFPDLPGISRFYEQFSERIEKRCNASVSRAARLYAHSHTPCGVSVSFRVTLYTQQYLSVLTDISVFNGISTALTRHALIWEKPSETPLSPADIFTDGIRTRRRLLSAVLDAIEKAVSDGTITPPLRSRRAVCASFSVRNCCLVPRGIAFFFDGGFFECEQGDIPLFVLPTDSVRDCLRLTF